MQDEIKKVKLPMYILYGVPYVPSLKKDEWVAPDAEFKTQKQLLERKAKLRMVELWPVGWKPSK